LGEKETKERGKQKKGGPKGRKGEKLEGEKKLYPGRESQGKIGGRRKSKGDYQIPQKKVKSEIGKSRKKNGGSACGTQGGKGG